MVFINDKNFNWKNEQQDTIFLSFKGSKDFARSALDFIWKESSEKNLTTALKKHLQSLTDYTGGVIETPTHIIAWVDHIRSWPLFYSQNGKSFTLSQNAYEIKNTMNAPKYNQDNLLEFKMSGYVTGKETLIEGLSAINPGEFLIWNKKKSTLNITKYFSYIPSFDSKVSQSDAIKQLGDIFDKLTLKIIKRANNRTIWIPLSGGLDSRILLCKLHEHGYKNIQTFTYGPRFNFEARIAKKIARRLNIPWRFVAIPRKTQKRYFNDSGRKRFWHFAGNLKAIPCMREYSAIRHLHEAGQIDQDAIFLNGQSGDYITGAHISTACKNNRNYDENSFYDVIIDKHYDLWKQYKTPENLAIIKDKINGLIKDITGKDISIHNQIDGATQEEIWEYEGRQICYVANGQRDYEHFGYDWEMPLWEKELVDFYQPLSFDMKYNQKLYKDYLKSYNYKNLFPEKEPYIWRWPLPILWVVPFAQIIGLFGGRTAKDKFYALMRYFGHYANQYAFFSWKEHKETTHKTRNIIALYIKKWFEENNLKL